MRGAPCPPRAISATLKSPTVETLHLEAMTAGSASWREEGIE